MENTRLIQLLRQFTPEEVRNFKKFVRSPYFNQRSEVVDLLDWLEKPLKSGRPVPAKNEAFQAVFGDKPFDDHRIRMSMSLLFQAANQFLAVSDFLQDQPDYHLRLAALLRRRKLSDQARQTRQRAGEAIRSAHNRNAGYHQQQYRFLLENYRAELDEAPGAPLPLQELSDQLDRSFLSRKLWQSCFMRAQQTVLNTHYDYGLLDTGLDFLQEKIDASEPAIQLYYHCYAALAEPSEPAHFQEFKRLLLQHSALFPNDELRDLYVLAINFCIRQYNAGNPEYLPEQFDFYRKGFENEYFLVEGALSHYTYQNAATVGLVLRELDWVEQFIHRYRDKLTAQYRDSLFSFNLARLNYLQRRFDEALQLLQKAEYRDLMLNLAAKTLQLKIYYELEEFDLLESHLQAFQTFIRRKKALGYHRENYLNTIQFTRKLLETNLYNKSQRAALQADIQATKSLAEKDWLLDQLNP